MDLNYVNKKEISNMLEYELLFDGLNIDKYSLLVDLLDQMDQFGEITINENYKIILTKKQK